MQTRQKWKTITSSSLSCKWQKPPFTNSTWTEAGFSFHLSQFISFENWNQFPHLAYSYFSNGRETSKPISTSFLKFIWFVNNVCVYIRFFLLFSYRSILMLAYLSCVLASFTPYCSQPCKPGKHKPFPCIKMHFTIVFAEHFPKVMVCNGKIWNSMVNT